MMGPERSGLAVPAQLGRNDAAVSTRRMALPDARIGRSRGKDREVMGGVEAFMGSDSSSNNAGLDIADLFSDRESERYALHTQFLNEQMVRVLRAIGYDVRLREDRASTSMTGAVTSISIC